MSAARIWTARDGQHEVTTITTVADVVGVKEAFTIQTIADGTAGVKEKTEVIAVADAGRNEVTRIDIATPTAGVKEITTVTTVADVADSLDGKYFLLYDKAGSVAFWIDTDNSGTTIPAGASAADRSVEITTIVTGDAASVVATAVRAAINADSKFSAPAPAGAVITVTDANFGARTNATAGDSGFTMAEATAGVTHNLDGKYIRLEDSGGSVGIWFDVDNDGTTEPAASGSLTRSIEVTTINNSDTAAAIATAIASKINADSKFSSTAALAEITVTNIEGAALIDSTAGDSGQTVTTTIQGVANSLDGKYLIISDDSGTVGIWFDIGNSGTTIPAGASGATRALEVTTINAGDTATQVAEAITTKLDADSKFSAYNLSGSVIITDASVGVRTDATAGDSGFTIRVDTQGKAVVSLDGKYILLQDDAGSVAFWIDVDNSGTTIPAGASAADRAVEVTTVTAAMTSNEVAGVLATAINADSKFTATANLSTVSVTVSTVGVKTDAADGDTGFTLATTIQGTAADLLDGTYVKFNDEVGTVGFWIDTDNSGTAEPAGSAALARSVEVTTVTSGMTATQVAGVLATAINADSKFSATASGDVVTVTSSTDGTKTDAADGAQATGFTIAVTKQGALTYNSESFISRGGFVTVILSGAFGTTPATVDVGFSPDDGTTWITDPSGDLTFTAGTIKNFDVALGLRFRLQLTAVDTDTAIDAWVAYEGSPGITA